MNRARLAIVVVALLLVGCAQPGRLHQVSTLQALLEGAYDGQVPCAELVRHGDLGLGTFDALDGEMLVLDGRVYQMPADGRVRLAPPGLTTPFANVAFFRPEQSVRFDRPTTQAELETELDRRIPTANLFYALRLDGRFRNVRVRSVPRQRKPYPRLADAARHQSVFELSDVAGTVVAFRCPPYVSGVNMPGWHMHFITADRRRGGHVLDFELTRGLARLATLRTFEMALPAGGRFFSADLARDAAPELDRIER